jgi:hypothetical protein
MMTRIDAKPPKSLRVLYAVRRRSTYRIYSDRAYRPVCPPPETPDARHRLYRGPVDLFRIVLRLFLSLQPAVTELLVMSFDIAVGGITFLGLLAYLMFVLVHSERF